MWPDQQRKNLSNNAPQQHHSREGRKQEGNGWFVPAALGAAAGAGLVYFLNRTATTSNGTAFEATPTGTCSICREDYQATTILRCGHILHSTCYDGLRQHSNGVDVLCPVCRQRVV